MLATFQRFFYLILFTVVLSACAPSGRYQQSKDSIPSRIPTQAELKDPLPRAEPKSRGGNKNYSVHGNYYQVLDSAVNFKERGIASFYGEKFHGHLTSNGEIYNMYSMSAAHKNLPLPTYVKVRNLTNNKTAIVRVNDRGPFHPGRIIDLSYAAAYKLGISGTAQVEIEAITDFGNPINTKVTPLNKSKNKSHLKLTNSKTSDRQLSKIIQVLATSDKKSAESITAKLSPEFPNKAATIYHNGFYKVILGPFNTVGERYLAMQKLKHNGFQNAFGKEMFLP